MSDNQPTIRQILEGLTLGQLSAIVGSIAGLVVGSYGVGMWVQANIDRHEADKQYEETTEAKNVAVSLNGKLVECQENISKWNSAYDTLRGVNEQNKAYYQSCQAGLSAQSSQSYIQDRIDRLQTKLEVAEMHEREAPEVAAGLREQILSLNKELRACR